MLERYGRSEIILSTSAAGHPSFQCFDTTKYYVCGNNWTVREISPSEGYLLDRTIHKVGAEPELYTVEFNSTALLRIL